MKTVIFNFKRDMSNDVVEEVQFSDRTTEDDINEELAQWAFEQIANNCTWHVKEE